MSDWHHHHDGDDQILFCRADEGDFDCVEEYVGLICEPDGVLWIGDRWVPCRYHLAFGDYVVDVAEQLVLVAHLEAVPDAEGDREHE